VVQALSRGAERAREIASETLSEARQSMGLGCPRKLG